MKRGISLFHATSAEGLAKKIHGNFRKPIQNEIFNTSYAEKHSTFLFLPPPPKKSRIMSSVNSQNRWVCLLYSKQPKGIFVDVTVFIYRVSSLGILFLPTFSVRDSIDCTTVYLL